MPPVGRVSGDDIEVTMDQQRRTGRILARDPGDDAGPAGMGLQDLRLEPGLGQERRDVFGRLTLTRTGMVTGVTGVDPDQVAADRDNLVVGGHFR